MGKIKTRLVRKEDVIDETKETEKTLLAETIYSSYSGMDLTEESLGKVKLECKCGFVLEIGRGLSATLACTQCGNKQLTSRSNFQMTCPEKEVDVKVGDEINSHRGGTGIWKID